MSWFLSVIEQLKALFQQAACWRLEELADRLDYAFISVHRFLSQIGYYRSYTHNGQWYTLPHIPTFNRDGLWTYQGIGFSQHGPLTATIGALVEQSPTGLSAQELAHKLQHRCPAVLTRLYQAGVLDRVQIQGEFRYLAKAKPLNRQQRQNVGAPPLLLGSVALSTAAAVQVLVAAIQHPDWDWDRVATQVQHGGHVGVTSEQVRQFFRNHGLKKSCTRPICVG